MDPRQDEGYKALGLNELHVAVLSGRKKHVRALLSRENKRELIESGDIDGTTPLMAAVLTGQVSAARLLLQNGASAQRRDHKGNTALEYSMASAFKKKIGTYRHLGFSPVSKKQTQRRRAIAKILRYPAFLRSTREAKRNKFSRTLLLTDGDKLRVLKHVMTFKIAKGKPERTKGFIVSSRQPTLATAATSGWGHNPSRGRDVLDNAKYTRLVCDTADILGFELPRNIRDHHGKALPEHRGRQPACHTEKKLAVFWILVNLKASFETTDLSRMSELRTAQVSEALKDAIIFLDHCPCSNCWDFLDRIERVTGLRIHVKSRPFLVKGLRHGLPGCRECPCQRCRKVHSLPPQGEAIDNSHTEDGSIGGGAASRCEDVETVTEAAGPQGDEASIPGPETNTDGNVGSADGPASNSTRRARPGAGPLEIQPTDGPQRWPEFESMGKPFRKPIWPVRVDTTLARVLLEPSSTRNGVPASRLQPPAPPAHLQRHPHPNPREAAPISSTLGDSLLSSRSLHDGSTTDIQKPVSAIAGRSGFFQTPDRRSELEIPLRPMHPRLRAEFDRVSDTSRVASLGERSGTPDSGSSEVYQREQSTSQRPTLQQTLKALNLRRFAHDGGESTPAATAAASAVSSPNTPDTAGREKRAGHKNKVVKKAASKRQKARVSKHEKLGKNSIFRRTVESSFSRMGPAR